LEFITDKAYSTNEILEMESEIVNTLQWNLTVPTTHTFLCRFLKAAHADRSMVQLACYLTERMLQEYSMLKYLPSVIAASAVNVARKSLHRHPWSPTLVKYTGYDENDIAPCLKEMKNVIRNPACQQQAVFRKYSSNKFGRVAVLDLTF
jgi:G2/mitotic-specific cyclin-B, other